jgi:hypothetical protein
MIFRCDKLEPQAIASKNYIQAIPPNYDSKSLISAKPSDGVVTPYPSFDCAGYKPHEPTHLPADTCLDFLGWEGRSVLIHQPAICRNGSTAFVESFPEPGCKTSDEFVSASQDGLSLNKKCFGSWDPHVRSMRFRCNDKAMKPFEDLPPHRHLEVEPLAIQEAVSPAGVIHKAQGGKIKTDCENDKRPESTSVKAVDTCVWTFMYESMEVKGPATCANGTQALFATYSRPGCKPEDLKYLGDLPDQFDGFCGDISKVDSFAFICEGLPESEIGNKGSVGGFLKFVGIVILILVLMIALSVLSCCLRGAAMMKQANELWAKIMDAFKGREGAIQL